MSDHYEEFRDKPIPPVVDANELVKRLVIERNCYFNLLLNFMSAEDIAKELDKYSKF